MQYPDYADLKLELADFILTIKFNRPHRKNALRPETVSELIDALQNAGDDEEVRCIVLTGEGGAFCSGADLKAMTQGSADEKASPVPLDPGGFPKLNLMFRKIGKPTIARVEGLAFAGGMGLMMACDIVIAADDAVFSTPEVKRGLWPMMIMRHIFANVPRKKAVELILTGKKIDAAEAEELGVITRAVAPDKLDEAVAETAALLAGYSPIIMKLGLHAMDKQFTLHDEEAFSYLEKQLGSCMQTEDFKEGIMAFAQKRKPEWKGR